MTNEEIYDRISRILVEKMKCDPASISRTANLTQLGLSSIDIIDAMFEVEEEFGVTFSDTSSTSDFYSDTVDTLVQAVSLLLSGENMVQDNASA